MQEFKKFIAITKVDAARREVYGVVTSEAPDKEGEICDYATTAPLYRAWSAEFETATEGRSLGNVREMHTQSAVGKITALDFNDDAKTISVRAQVVDDDAWKKCEAGVYTGFSHGGKYLKVWPDEAGEYRRYTAEPSEISLVDNPCNPEAHFEYVKADGSTEVRKFSVPSTQYSVPNADVDRVDEVDNMDGVDTAAAPTLSADADKGGATQKLAEENLAVENQELREQLATAEAALAEVNAQLEKLLAEPRTRKASGHLVNMSKARNDEPQPRRALGDRAVLKACLATPIE
jgi:hypothetical protein